MCIKTPEQPGNKAWCYLKATAVIKIVKIESDWGQQFLCHITLNCATAKQQ